MVLILTLTAMKAAIPRDFAHRMMITKSEYDRDRQREIHIWCRDRFGRSAFGRAVNRDAPGFFRLGDGSRFVDPDVAMFEYDASRSWVHRYTAFYFHEIDHAFEFKMRWK